MPSALSAIATYLKIEALLTLVDEKRKVLTTHEALCWAGHKLPPLVRTLVVFEDGLSGPLHRSGPGLRIARRSSLSIAADSVVRLGHQPRFIPNCAFARLPLHAAYIAELGSAGTGFTGVSN